MAEDNEVVNVPAVDSSDAEPKDGEQIPESAPVAPEASEPAVAAPETTVTSLDLDDDTVTQTEAPDLEAVEPVAFSQPIVAPPGLDLSNPDQVAQVTYGQTQQVYTQPQFSAAPPTDQPGYAQPGYAQPGYAQPSAPPPPYQQAPPSYPPGTYLPAPAATAPMTREDENMWAAAAHWSALAASVVGLGFAGPLVVYLVKSQESARVRAAAAESLNFEITYILALIVSFLAVFVFIGFITTPVIIVGWLVLRILAAIAASRGEDYRYPVNIRMVH